MREEYYQIYGDLTNIYQAYYSYIYPEFLPLIIFREDREQNLEILRSLRKIMEAIENVVGDLGLTRRIRPDAKHFLIINLHQMVILPTSLPDTPTDVNIQQEDLENDIRVILEDINSRYANEEISGHKVLGV